jgi:hypothetical protein
MSPKNEINNFNPETNLIKESILAEIALFEQNANLLPQEKDIEVLKKVRAIWVLSGSGSYLKPLINTVSDQINIDNYWYHGTDKARLDYAKRWLSAYQDLLPDNQPPTLIYNGVPEQNQDLLEAVKEKKYQIPADQLYIAPGNIVRTLDQVKKFSFPPDFDLENGYSGVLSHASHLPRILRFMSKNQEIFKGINVLALPLKSDNPQNQIKMIEPEVKGILDYIEKDEANTDSYSYKLLGKEK